MKRPRTVRHIAKAFLVLGLIAACGTPGASEGNKLYRIPTSSWRLGDASLHASTVGTLAAGNYRHKWCLWLVGSDSRRIPVVWPAGFRARRHPLELLDPGGTVVARGGVRIQLTGGLAPAKHGCSTLGQKEAFYAMGYPTAA